MIRSLRLSPVMTLSRSPMPVLTGRTLSSASRLSESRRSKVCKSTALSRSKPPFSLPLRMSKIRCSAESRSTVGSSAAAVASSMISREAVISRRSLYLSATIWAYAAALDGAGQLLTRSTRYGFPVASSKALFCFSMSSSVTKSIALPKFIISCIASKMILCREI